MVFCCAKLEDTLNDYFVFYKTCNYFDSLWMGAVRKNPTFTSDLWLGETLKYTLFKENHQHVLQVVRFKYIKNVDPIWGRLFPTRSYASGIFLGVRSLKIFGCLICLRFLEIGAF